MSHADFDLSDVDVWTAHDLFDHVKKGSLCLVLNGDYHRHQNVSLSLETLVTEWRRDEPSRIFDQVAEWGQTQFNEELYYFLVLKPIADADFIAMILVDYVRGYLLSFVENLIVRLQGPFQRVKTSKVGSEKCITDALTYIKGTCEHVPRVDMELEMTFNEDDPEERYTRKMNPVYARPYDVCKNLRTVVNKAFRKKGMDGVDLKAVCMAINRCPKKGLHPIHIFVQLWLREFMYHDAVIGTLCHALFHNQNIHTRYV